MTWAEAGWATFFGSCPLVHFGKALHWWSHLKKRCLAQLLHEPEPKLKNKPYQRGPNFLQASSPPELCVVWFAWSLSLWCTCVFFLGGLSVVPVLFIRFPGSRPAFFIVLYNQSTIAGKAFFAFVGKKKTKKGRRRTSRPNNWTYLNLSRTLALDISLNREHPIDSKKCRLVLQKPWRKEEEHRREYKILTLRICFSFSPSRIYVHPSTSLDHS
jgi:hypothetical protein